MRTESWRGRTPTGKSASIRGAMPERSTIASRRRSFASASTAPSSEQCDGCLLLHPRQLRHQVAEPL